MNYIDTIINRVTMYRLLLYYLLFILGVAMILGALGILSYSPYSIAFTASYFVLACLGVNFIFAKVYDAPTNWESSILTGLILSLIITPASSYHTVPFLTAAAGLAIASKYLLAIRNKHIFNPVAIAVVLTAFGPEESASWWVGTSALVPVILIGGLLLGRKVRRLGMISVFVATAIITTVLLIWLEGRDTALAIQNILLRSSLLFLAFVMLTEPWTSPTTNSKRIIYAILVGILFSPSVHIGNIHSTPEIALIIGNIFAFAVTPTVKTRLSFARRRTIGQRTEDIEFTPEHPFSFTPGQYIEITLPHKSPDSRGLRRYFTIASSPTEDTVHFGIRYYEPGSSFKKALRKEDDELFLSAGQLGGDFTLPKGKKQKLAFIAGGIGITPFRSMVKYLTDTQDDRSVKLLYAENTTEDITYSDVFEDARRKVHVDTTYVVSNLQSSRSPYMRPGYIDKQLITSLVPDYLERIFYISGPQSMVVAMKANLTAIGVPTSHIKSDYFFGYA
ncbi:RnfABCDGE type electron transport complex subunit D [Candidatus Saccharibacteria bacterium]|nr:RnfABCDGE type electron transport complex subunit D [Candidatus Saccharibacteria bacterium]